MRVNVTFRHMDATEAIKAYAEEKVGRIKKYFPDPITAHVVFSTERGYQHVADVNITLHNGLSLQGREITEDMYSSIDLVMAKIERQVRKYKDRIRSHKPHSGATIPVRNVVLEAQSVEPHPYAAEADHDVEEAPAAPPELETTGAPRVIRSSKFFAKPMTVDEAVMQMNLLGNEFLVFMNATTREVNVVYRREDGNYGLIETGRTDEGQAGTIGVSGQPGTGAQRSRPPA